MFELNDIVYQSFKAYCDPLLCARIQYEHWLAYSSDAEKQGLIQKMESQLSDDQREELAWLREERISN